MSTATSTNVITQRWLPAEQLPALGFEPNGPEIDYGMRWGERGDIRVSFAPRRDRDDGYLYAHERSTDRYLILAAHTTREQVEVVWRELIDRTASPDGYLALAVLDHDQGVMRPDQAHALFWHCLDREITARRHFTLAGPDERFQAANAVVTERSARVAAERLLLGAVAAQTAEAGPVIVRYRMLQQPDWTGRVVASNLPQAAHETRQLLDAARRHGFDLLATSVTRGWTTVSAARVPQLEFAATRPPLRVDAPSIGI